jgi:hypothetical protein
MTLVERAVAHGYLRATVKGHWDRRERAVARRPAPRRTHDPAAFARFADLGATAAGPSADGPEAVAA